MNPIYVLILVLVITLSTSFYFNQEDEPVIPYKTESIENYMQSVLSSVKILKQRGHDFDSLEQLYDRELMSKDQVSYLGEFIYDKESSFIYLTRPMIEDPSSRVGIFRDVCIEINELKSSILTCRKGSFEDIDMKAFVTYKQLNIEAGFQREGTAVTIYFAVK